VILGIYCEFNYALLTTNSIHLTTQEIKLHVIMTNLKQIPET